MAGDVKLRYVNLPITFDQSLDGIAYDYGDEGLGRVLRLVCACASQQAREPFYMINVTGERGWTLLARRLGFDSIKECMEFVSDLRAEGLCEIVNDGNREYLGCFVVNDGIEGYRRRCERAQKAAEARWAKKDGGGEAEQG